MTLPGRGGSAVMIADGGEAIADLAVLRDQAELFGRVASDPTAVDYRFSATTSTVLVRWGGSRRGSCGAGWFGLRRGRLPAPRRRW
jgi:hypothetical protein